MLPFTEGKQRGCKCWVKAKPCSLGRRGSPQGHRKQATMTQDLCRKAHKEKEGKPSLGAHRCQRAELLPLKVGSVPTAIPQCPLHLLRPPSLGLYKDPEDKRGPHYCLGDAWFPPTFIIFLSEHPQQPAEAGRKTTSPFPRLFPCRETGLGVHGCSSLCTCVC